MVPEDYSGTRINWPQNEKSAAARKAATDCFVHGRLAPGL